MKDNESICCHIGKMKCPFNQPQSWMSIQHCDCNLKAKYLCDSLLRLRMKIMDMLERKG